MEKEANTRSPGTELNKRWCAQVDAIAFYLKKLQDARIPVLWPPYHEMNGDWFWWGGRRGEYSTKTFIVEWGDDRVAEEKLTLDGKEIKSEFWNSPKGFSQTSLTVHSEKHHLQRRYSHDRCDFH